MARRKNPSKGNWLRATVHIGALVPFALLAYDFFTANLTVNPIQEATLRTGKTALVLLVLSLAASPLCFILDYNPILKTRRTLGLYAFFYAGIHFIIFIWLDYGLNWDFIVDGFLEKPFALVGFAAFLILLALAITSTDGWKRRLGKAWKKLHRWVYAAGLLVIVHYIWVVKSDTREPLAWGAALALLLLLRIPRFKWWVRNKVDSFKRTWRKKNSQGEMSRQPAD